MNKVVGLLGLSAVGIFLVALVVLGSLNSDFHFLDDYVSKLGAKGQLNAIWFNVFGFFLVGVLLIGFGLSYGKFIQNKWVGILLALFGVGFALTSIPTDMEHADSPVSKIHFLAITLGLASWLIGLARMAYNQSLTKQVRLRANIAAVLLVSSMIGFGIGLWSMPMTHRLVFCVVFGWIAITATELLMEGRK